MISDIYIPTFTILRRFEDEVPFKEFIAASFPSCIKGHLPEHIDFIDIEYKQDKLVEAFMEMLVSEEIESIIEMKKEGLEIENGYFHVRLKSEENLTHRQIPSIEFVFQKLHESYHFVTSHHYYLGKNKIIRFVKMFTFESDEEDDDHTFETLQNYTALLDSYFYKGEIPDSFSNEVAKMFLLQGRI